MDKTKEFKKSRLALISADEEDHNELKKQLNELDGKVQQMLLWSNICALWSYVILIIMIARLYSNFEGKHRALMVGTLSCLYVFLAILLMVTWKNTAYMRANFKKASKTYIDYHIKTLARQCKLISFYLVIYTLLLTVASFFFFRDIHNGLTLILKLTAPVSTVTYLLGLYFIVQFKRRRRSLKVLDQQIDHMAFMEKVWQN